MESRPHRHGVARGRRKGLWALAVSIEDGNITRRPPDKALRAAQDALKQALGAAPATKRSRS